MAGPTRTMGHRQEGDRNYVVFFEPGSSSLPEQGWTIVDYAVSDAQERRTPFVILISSPAVPQAQATGEVSARRLDVVRKQFIRSGIDASQVLARSHAELPTLLPIADRLLRPDSEFVKISILENCAAGMRFSSPGALGSIGDNR